MKKDMEVFGFIVVALTILSHRDWVKEEQVEEETDEDDWEEEAMVLHFPILYFHIRASSLQVFSPFQSINYKHNIISVGDSYSGVAKV